MTSKAYTRATRMAATFLAKMNGADAAATAFGIDPRTLRSWLQTVEIPDDQWTAIRDVLLARGAEMAALGKTAGLPAVLTGAGISDRNVRYGVLIARREARRTEDENPARTIEEQRTTAWDEVFLWSGLSEDASEYLRHARRVLVEYLDGQDDEFERPPTDDEMTAVRLGMDLWLRRIADTSASESSLSLRRSIEPDADTLSIDQYRSLLEELRAQVEQVAVGYARRMVAGHVVTRHNEHGRTMYRIVDEKGRSVLHASYLPSVYDEHTILIEGAEPRLGSADDVSGAPLEPKERAEDIHPVAERPALPATPVPARPAPVPMVVDTGSSDHDRGWYAYERRDQ